MLPPDHPLPARDLSQYSVDGDPHSENDIRGYVHGQARDDTVQHVEKIKEEFVLGGKYEIWDVITEKDRYWVITNLTNLYSQKHFPSLDYTLSFHIGLMMRFRSRPETLRAMTRVLSMKYSAVKSRPRTETIEPLKLRTIKLWACISESPCFHWPKLRRRVELPADIERPQDANFVAWSALLMDQLCAGGGNKELRQHLKNIAKEIMF